MLIYDNTKKKDKFEQQTAVEPSKTSQTKWKTDRRSQSIINRIEYDSIYEVILLLQKQSITTHDMWKLDTKQFFFLNSRCRSFKENISPLH